MLAGPEASTGERLPKRAELADRYAESSGRDLDRLDFHLGVGYFNLQGLTGGTGFDAVGEAPGP
ncbi:hypothetical protein AB0K02_11240 [Streptomyces sp. NPDC049597]|uniref:hypothetical protein n=1 Tax=Streptomyces sp. NPDC049597 TaxID=3155276 RepID=UPI00342E9441